MHRKLYRSRDRRLVSGIMGGLGEYFGIDPVILRLVFILVLIATGVFPGVIAYVVGAFVVPETPSIAHSVPITDDDPAV